MFSMHQEPSGSILIKARYKEGQNGGLCDGGVTQNGSLYLKKKNIKQINRELDRAKKNHAQSSPNHPYDLRSTIYDPTDIETPRYEPVPPMDFSVISPKVTSPVEKVVSTDVTDSPELHAQLLCSPETPPMREFDQALDDSVAVMISEPEEMISGLKTIDPLETSNDSLDPDTSHINSNSSVTSTFEYKNAQFREPNSTEGPISPVKTTPSMPSTEKYSPIRTNTTDLSGSFCRRK